MAALAPEQVSGYPWVAAGSKHERLLRVSDTCQCCGELQVVSVFYHLLGWEEGIPNGNAMNMGQEEFLGALLCFVNGSWRNWVSGLGFGSGCGLLWPVRLGILGRV